MLEDFIFIAIVSFLGIIIQTSTGFGYGIFVMALFPMFLEYTDALVASGITGLLLTVVNVIRYRKNIQIKKVIIPLLGYSVASALGTWLLQWIYFQIGEEAKTEADAILKRVLGVVLIVLSLYLMFFSDKIKIKPTPITGLCAGGLGGAMNSIFGMGGPPVVVYFLSVAENNILYLAMIQMYFLIGNVYTTALRAFNGMVTLNSLWYTLASISTLIPGIFLGGRIFKKLNPKTLRLMVYCFMIIMGIFFLIKG